MIVHSISFGSTCLVLPDQSTADSADIGNQYGPLSPLIGTWVGDKGLNIVAVPSRRSSPTDTGRFELIVKPYREVLTFTPIDEPVRNRGGSLDQYIGALSYEQKVFATDGVPEELIHVESGMFFYLDHVVEYQTTTSSAVEYSIGRSASIPHGNAAMLLGTAKQYDGPPLIPTLLATPSDAGSKAPKEYTNPYQKPADITNPNSLLQRAATSQNIIRTTHLSLDSNNGGTVSSVPFLLERANTSRFRSDFWIEQLEGGNEQLQYSQCIDIEFHEKIGGSGLISWPHVTVNTLTKDHS